MKLLIFVPCEKVIIDRAANVVSLISVLEELTAAEPSDEPVPENAVAPQVWYVLSVWRREGDEEIGQRFEQQLTLQNPNGKEVLKAHSPVFEMKKPHHRMINTIRGFPVGVPGNYTLTVALRREGESDFVERATYPLLVKSHDQPDG